MGSGRHGRRLPPLPGSGRCTGSITLARNRAQSIPRGMAFRGGEAAGTEKSSIDPDDVPLLDIVSRKPSWSRISATLDNWRDGARAAVTSGTGGHSVRVPAASWCVLDAGVSARDGNCTRRPEWRLLVDDSDGTSVDAGMAVGS